MLQMEYVSNCSETTFHTLPNGQVFDNCKIYFSSSVMDFFDNSNWRMTKFLLSCFGGWPFQSPRTRIILQCTVFILIASILVPEVMKLIFACENRNMAIECAPILALHLLTVAKLMNCLINMQKTKQLLLQIQKDWQISSSEADVKTLKSFGKTNRRIIHTYIYYIYATTATFLLTPLSPKILDLVIPLNESRPPLPLYQTEYFVDSNKYEILILLHQYIISPFPSTIIVAFDALYANCVHHACNMFIIIGDQLKHTIKNLNVETGKYNKLDEQRIYDSLVCCIKKHREILEFSDLVESSYSTILVFIIGINMVALSITGFQTIMKIGETSEMIRFGCFSIGQLVHLYFFTSPGQKLEDQSSHIYESIYQSDWYELPLKSKRILVLVMMRSRKPCRLRAGKMYTMTSQNFSQVVQKSASYLTVLTSMS